MASSCFQVENQIEIYQSKQTKDQPEENKQQNDYIDIFLADNSFKNTKEPQYSLQNNQEKSQNVQKSESAYDNQGVIVRFQDDTEVNQNDEEFTNVFVPNFLTKSREFVEKRQSINSNYPILCIQNQNFKDEIIDQNEHTNTNENLKNQNNQKKVSNTYEGLQTQEQIITSPKQSPETNRLMISPKSNLDSISAVSREGTRQKQQSHLKSSLFQNQNIEMAHKQQGPLPNQKISVELLNKIFTIKQKITQNKMIQKSFEKLFFKQKLIGKRNYQQSLGIDNKSLTKINNQVNKQSDIYQIYKDIIFLKKAMMIILNKEQLAALQLVGCSNEFLDIDHIDKNQNFSEIIQKYKLSHFEQNMAVSENFDLQQEFINKFYQKCKNKQAISEIDKRILSSIVMKNRFN
ncbi:hypothetical protein ABPG74_012051 [Tetrahymena malaccensis]